jgi:hypothetical protein
MPPSGGIHERLVNNACASQLSAWHSCPRRTRLPSRSTANTLISLAMRGSCALPSYCRSQSTHEFTPFELQRVYHHGNLNLTFAAKIIRQYGQRQSASCRGRRHAVVVLSAMNDTLLIAHLEAWLAFCAETGERGYVFERLVALLMQPSPLAGVSAPRSPEASGRAPRTGGCGG